MYTDTQTEKDVNLTSRYSTGFSISVKVAHLWKNEGVAPLRELLCLDWSLIYDLRHQLGI